jgi:uncharacterized protein HemY
MDASNPQGLLWLFVVVFAGLLVGTAWLGQESKQV